MLARARHVGNEVDLHRDRALSAHTSLVTGQPALVQRRVGLLRGWRVEADPHAPISLRLERDRHGRAGLASGDVAAGTVRRGDLIPTSAAAPSAASHERSNLDGPAGAAGWAV